ncbi:MAG: MBL fold metallo-hydrolase [Succinivibrio sp.]
MITYQSVVVTPYSQNCRIFLNTESNEAVVSDPGGSAQKIYEAVNRAGYTIRSILITHMHLDHVGGVYELAKLSGASVYGSSIEDAALMQHFDEQASMLCLQNTQIFDNTFVTDAQILRPMDDFELKVITTPGHTPGGVCYYCEKEKLVLTGDTLFQGSVGRTDFPGGSYDSIVDSIRNKLFLLPDDTQVLSGHGPDSSIGEEKQFNPYVSL